MAKRAAIVGAGLSGLTSLKHCLAEGIEAVIFEAQSHIGGQWKYTTPNATGHVHSSIYEGVVLNSCRDTTAFSDFPMDPSKYPDYFGHRLFLQYIHDYAEFFHLKEHVRLSTRVKECKQVDNGAWMVSYQEEGKEIMEERFDAVFACTGHNTVVQTPVFEGRETFKGQFLHSHLYRTPGPFEGKSVAVIGIGASAVDIACEIAPQAKELNLITRRGGWIIPRYLFGTPVEAYDSRAAQTLVPASISQWVQKKLMDFAEGKHPPELIPEHNILEANPTVRGDFLEKVRVGFIKPHRAGVSQITENGLITTKGTELSADVIISCTGYFVEYPYLPEDSYRPKESEFPNSVELYELIHPLRYRNLFFIGLPEVPGPLGPVVEAQTRWATAVLADRIKLPSQVEMEKSIKSFQESVAKNWVHSNRHSFSTPYIDYCDRVLQPLGAAPSFWKLFRQVFSSGHPFRSLKLLSAVYMDVASAGQFRLFGHGNRADLARESVLRIAKGGKELSKAEKKQLEALATGSVVAKAGSF